MTEVSKTTLLFYRALLARCHGRFPLLIAPCPSDAFPCLITAELHSLALITLRLASRPSHLPEQGQRFDQPVSATLPELASGSSFPVQSSFSPRSVHIPSTLLHNTQSGLSIMTDNSEKIKKVRLLAGLEFRRSSYALRLCAPLPTRLSPLLAYFIVSMCMRADRYPIGPPSGCV